jgi:methylmalonyl-CoA/ethylmalonyl-CoA epimerase
MFNEIIMKPTHIEHIGIAVKNLGDAINLYEKLLGIECYKIEEVADQKVRTVFFLIGQTKIELLESTDSDGPIGKFIEKRGEGIHHIAFAVENIEVKLAQAEQAGITLIDQKPRKGADGLDIAFIHPKSTAGVLIELCEQAKLK